MSFLTLKKNLKKDFSGCKKVRLALAGDSATQLFAQAIRAQGYEAGLDLEILETDYDQIDRQIRDAGSELHRFKPEIVVVFQATPKLLKCFYALDNGRKNSFAKDQSARIAGWCALLNQQSYVPKIISLNFPEIDDSVFGNYANKTSLSFLYQLRYLNCALMDLAQQVKNLFVCDIAGLQNRVGSVTASDPRLYVDADLVYTPDFYALTARALLDIVQAASGVFKKCVILDLDNTLWGGVIGDDGLDRIQIGALGAGKAFTELQYWLKQLKKRGILLAVCSKNDETIAKEPFEKHADMVLSLDDFSVFLANWDSKVDNIHMIKSLLNIGYDSMVFLDDNPFERNVVRTHIPELTVPELPEDPAEYLPYLRNLNLFETSSFTENDEERTQQLKEEIQRKTVEKTFTSETEFLASLEMTGAVEPFGDFSLPRVAQLIQRSNQFNLRTMRYGEEDIRRMMDSGKHHHLSVSLRDKFGDYGLISAIILAEQPEGLFIDTWVMSCRVLRRGVESLALDSVVAIAKERRLPFVLGEYIPTKKNELVKDHYAKLGFTLNEKGIWQLGVDGYKSSEHFIRRKA